MMQMNGRSRVKRLEEHKEDENEKRTLFWRKKRKDEVKIQDYLMMAVIFN